MASGHTWPLRADGGSLGPLSCASSHPPPTESSRPRHPWFALPLPPGRGPSAPGEPAEHLLRCAQCRPGRGASCKGCPCRALGEEPRMGAGPGRDPATRLGAGKLGKRFTRGSSCGRQSTASRSQKCPELSCASCLYILEINPFVSCFICCYFLPF